MCSDTAESDSYFISPVLDLSGYSTDLNWERFNIMATAGLWNVVTLEEAIDFVDNGVEEMIQSSMVANAVDCFWSKFSDISIQCTLWRGLVSVVSHDASKSRYCHIHCHYTHVNNNTQYSLHDTDMQHTVHLSRNEKWALLKYLVTFWSLAIDQFALGSQRNRTFVMVSSQLGRRAFPPKNTDSNPVWPFTASVHKSKHNISIAMHMMMDSCS